MVHDKDIYIRQKFYKSGMTIDDIEEGISEVNEEIIADSSAKQTIETLKARGYWLEPSVKGADSVVNGIRQLLGYNIHICEDSIDVLKEFEEYTWKLDKFGLPTDQPIDKFNHAIDAIRYAIEKVETSGNLSELGNLIVNI
jgi:phage terminase large subunit